MGSNLQTITLTQPDDWHVHLRAGEYLKHTVPDIARQFGRAIIMPNLKNPVTTVKAALDYKQDICKALPENSHFTPLMTLYLTDNFNVGEITQAKNSGDDAEGKNGEIVAAKLYPAGATTNSDAGVTDVKKIYPILESMEKLGMPLLVHGEVSNPDIDIFDREAVFIDQILIPLKKSFPELKVVLEHITTKNAVDFVLDSDKSVAATITAHHLMYNRNQMLAGGIKPHYYCLPILKRNTHQQALIKAATSGHKKFFLGTDSAPHSQASKESACGCAGSYTAHAAMALYTQVFEEADSLDKLEQFSSFSGPDFYGLPRNTSSITLKKKAWIVPDSLPFGDETLIPLCAGETLSWLLDSSQTS